MLILFGNCIIIIIIIIIIIVVIIIIIIIIIIIMFHCGGFVDLGRSKHKSILECKGDNHF